MNETTPTPSGQTFKKTNSNVTPDKVFPSKRFRANHLEEVRSQLSSFSVDQNEIKLNFENFLANIRGISSSPLGEIEINVLRTRRSLFVLCDLAPSDLARSIEGISDLNMDRKVILRENDQTRTLIHLSYSDYGKMLEAQFEEGERKLRHSIAPETNPLASKTSFQNKLRQCKILLCSDPEFDVEAFASSVRFAFVFQDENDFSYYHIKAGEGDVYSLYLVDEAPSTITAIHLSYGNEHLLLLREN